MLCFSKKKKKREREREGFMVCKTKCDVRSISIPYLILRFLDRKQSQYLKTKANFYLQVRVRAYTSAVD